MSQAYSHHYQTMHITQPSENPFASQASLPPSNAIEYTDDVDTPSAPPTVVTVPPPSTQSPQFPLYHEPNPEADLKPPTTVATSSTEARVGVNLPFAVPQSIQVTLSSAMRMIGDHQAHMLGAQQAWYARADSFNPASPSVEGAPPARSSAAVRVSKDIGTGMAILVAAPVAVAGAAVVATGGMLYGVGLLLKGIGGALTCGVAY
ncbi:hypothetical protein BDN72DRAFT_842973 [Pluteus cervinus]|uniref:Uncharacterized protein n=1 Tax=Pluteus cervinus TaxID=181527 RepID=A0ACD3APK7_9AGAR|nr:hypothetical protein BDN72DRAFT_842973 [Pluteus cervinus]